MGISEGEMSTRYAIGSDFDGEFVNLFNDNRTFKSLGYAKKKCLELQGATVKSLYLKCFKEVSQEEVIQSLKSENDKLKQQLAATLQVIEKFEKSNEFYANKHSWRRSSLADIAREVVAEDLDEVVDYAEFTGGKLARQIKKEVEELKKGLLIQVETIRKQIKEC
jgi:hypothetical protein